MSAAARTGLITMTVNPATPPAARTGLITMSVTPARPQSVKVRVGGVWRDASVKVRKAGAWVPAVVLASKGGAWIEAGVPAVVTPPSGGGGGTGGGDTGGGTTTSGIAIPAADLPGWKLAYSEDFDRAAAIGQIAAIYGSDFAGYGGADTSGHGTYTPAQVLSAHDSLLDWFVHTTSDGTHRVATPLPTGKTGRLYSRVAICFRSDPLPGYKIAFLQWPTSNNWSDGELDMPEADLDGVDTVSGFVHQPGNPSHNALAAGSTVVAADGKFHVAIIEWTAAGVKYWIDGTLIGSTTVSPSAPMYLALQQETALSPAPEPADAVSGHVEVDWVAIWNFVAIAFSTLTGSTFNAKLASADPTKEVAFGNGTFSWSDFTLGVFGPASNGAVGGYGVDYAGAGIIGAGIDKTVLEMTPNTMTKNAPTTQGPTNGYSLLRCTHDGVVIQDLTIAGTDQGGGTLTVSAPSTLWKQKCYNGVRWEGVVGGAMTRVKLSKAGPGWDFQPAGETFAVNDFNGSDNVYTDVEVDGGGQGASGFATNSNARPTYLRCSSHDNPFSAGWAFWQTDSGTLTDCSTSGCHTGISFERCWGTWTLTRFKFGAAAPHHIYLGSDNYNGKGIAQVTFIDPVLPAGSKLIAYFPAVEQGGTNFQTKASLQVLATQPDGSRRDVTSTVVTFAGTPHA